MSKIKREIIVSKVKETADRLLSPSKLSMEEAEDFVARIEEAADEVISERQASETERDTLH